jgi:hypothetical protein
MLALVLRKDGGTQEKVRGMGLLIRRAIPKVYQGYTKTIDISTSQDGRNTQNIFYPTGILGMVTEC